MDHPVRRPRTQTPSDLIRDRSRRMKVLFEEQEIRRGISKLAAQLHEHYGDRPLTIVAIMTGSLVMLADLIRCMEMPIRISLIRASSYRGGMQSGNLVIDDSDMLDIAGRDVLLIDDIFDTGKTLVQVTQRLERLQPKSIRTAVFLHKQGTSTVEQRPDYSVFEIPNAFVVGYGLDYRDHYRNLPYVGVLEESDLQQWEHESDPSLGTTTSNPSQSNQSGASRTC